MAEEEYLKDHDAPVPDDLEGLVLRYLSKDKWKLSRFCPNLEINIEPRDEFPLATELDSEEEELENFDQEEDECGDEEEGGEEEEEGSEEPGKASLAGK